jgi:hypothetical protein
MSKVAFPVDLVYAWVENTREHQILRQQYLPRSKRYGSQGYATMRYRCNHEIYESIKSALKFLPWLNHIYVVADDTQTPNIAPFGSKVSVVHHSEFIPQHHLPTFNSHSIEANLHNIPNLSDHFIYANDDMFFGNPLSSGDFFTPTGLPRFFLSGYMPKGPPRFNTQAHIAARMNNTSVLKKVFGEGRFRTAAHQAKALSKELYEYGWSDSTISSHLRRTSASKFRSRSDVDMED